MILLRINIYNLAVGEYIDFSWNHELEVCYRIEGTGQEYTSMTVSYPYYLSSGKSTIAVLFNRNDRDIDYAFCSIFIWKLPIGSVSL